MITFLVAALLLQSGGTWIGGTIVDVRGDIVQIRPRRQTGLTRVIVGKSTQIMRGELAPLSMLKPGDLIFARGEYVDGGPFRCVEMEEGEGNDGAGGLEADSYSQLFMLNGTVVSNSPLVVKDDKGKKYNIEDHNCRLTYDMPKDRSAIVLGKLAFFHGKTTADGLTDVDFAWVDGVGQNSDSYLTGKLVTASADKVSIRNQFQDKPQEAQLSSTTPIYILTDALESSVKIGERVYVQAENVPAANGVPESKLVRFIGVGDGPAIPLSSDDPMIKSIELRGTVTSFFPCVVKTDSGEVVSLIVPGQARIATVRAATISDVQIGDDVVAAGTDKPAGLSVKYLLVMRKPKRSRTRRFGD